MWYWSRLFVIVALIAMLPINSYVMASEEKKEPSEKPFYFGVFGGFSFPENANLRPSSPPRELISKVDCQEGLRPGGYCQGNIMADGSTGS